MPFLKLAEKLWNERQIEVIHGPVYGLDLDSRDEDEQVLVDANPVIVLIEFGKLMGFRLMDLFAALDKDGSKTLSKTEIRNGLKVGEFKTDLWFFECAYLLTTDCGIVNLNNGFQVPVKKIIYMETSPAILLEVWKFCLCVGDGII